MAWAKIPTAWVRDDLGLRDFTWREQGADATAALILLIALAIRSNQANRIEDVTQRGVYTYDNLHALTLLSRAKIATGLRLLEKHKIITVARNKRTNQYTLPGISEGGKWAQLPQSYLLVGRVLKGFSGFQLRHRTELNALKLYLLLLAYRDVKGNFTAIGYERICELTGFTRNDVVRARSLLISLELITFNLVFFEKHEQLNDDFTRASSRYRILGFGIKNELRSQPSGEANVS